jgi:hypothetical protein
VVQDGARRNPGGAGVGEDPDLEFDTTGGWEGGNLQGTRLDNALIIQEHTGIAKWNGSVSSSPRAVDRGHLYFVQGEHNWGTNNNWQKYAPDDEARGGSINFNFETTIDNFGFDFIDLDRGENVSNTTITFTDTVGNQSTISFDEFTSGGDFDQTGNSGEVVWGDGTANRIDGISLDQINNFQSSFGGNQLNNFDQVTINLNGSGGIATIRYNLMAPVPEASTVISASAIALLIGVHFYRRRKAKASA